MKGFSINVKLVRERQGAIYILKEKKYRYKGTTTKIMIFNIITVQILNKGVLKKTNIYLCLADHRHIVFLVLKRETEF